MRARVYACTWVYAAVCVRGWLRNNCSTCILIFVFVIRIGEVFCLQWSSSRDKCKHPNGCSKSTTTQVKQLLVFDNCANSTSAAFPRFPRLPRLHPLPPPYNTVSRIAPWRTSSTLVLVYTNIYPVHYLICPRLAHVSSPSKTDLFTLAASTRSSANLFQ